MTFLKAVVVSTTLFLMMNVPGQVCLTEPTFSLHSERQYEISWGFPITYDIYRQTATDFADVATNPQPSRLIKSASLGALLINILLCAFLGYSSVIGVTAVDCRLRVHLSWLILIVTGLCVILGIWVNYNRRDNPSLSLAQEGFSEVSEMPTWLWLYQHTGYGNVHIIEAVLANPTLKRHSRLTLSAAADLEQLRKLRVLHVHDFDITCEFLDKIVGHPTLDTIHFVNCSGNLPNRTGVVTLRRSENWK